MPLRWKADSQPLDHQGSPSPGFFFLRAGSSLLRSLEGC